MQKRDIMGYHRPYLETNRHLVMERKDLLALLVAWAYPRKLSCQFRWRYPTVDGQLQIPNHRIW